MKKHTVRIKSAGFWHSVLLTACAAALAVGLMAETASAPESDLPARVSSPPPAVGAAEQGERIAEGCEIIQTMAFTRCGHSVTRRVEAPDALIGKDFAAAQAYYSVWQIESYRPEHIDMQREIPLFCPIHTVAGVNEAGEAVLARNLYGDGMAVIRDTGRILESFSPEERDALLQGLGFDSEEEAEAWLREH